VVEAQQLEPQAQPILATVVEAATVQMLAQPVVQAL
jgi:hypothetical protein